MKQYFRHLFAIVLLISSLTAWGQSFSGSGSGTASDPYLIYNPNHLNDVHNFIGQNGVVFKLMQDIDLTSWLAENNPTNGWLPIGTEAQPFKGKFLGNNKTISGLFITRASTNDVGFFGYADGATISNLTINGTTVKGADHTGGLCGIALNSTISSCHVTIGVTGSTTNIGGFIGSNQGCTINNCSYTGDVSGPSSIAGFSGTARNSNISNVTINANVTSTNTNSGQCIGYIGTGTTTITNVQAVGNLNVKSNAGGLVGYARTGCVLTIKNSSVNSNITGTSYLGGVIGISEADVLTITNCKSIGDITGTSYLGGIVGYNKSQTTVSTTYHDGKITASGQCVGGLIGYNVDGYSVEGCGHIGDISGTSYVSGGIGRSFNNETSTIYTTDTNYQATASKISNISNCFSVGDVYASGNYVGGLAGSSELCCTVNVNLAIDLSSKDLYKNYNLNHSMSHYVYKYIINGTTYYSETSYDANDFPGCSFSRTITIDKYILYNAATGTINTSYTLAVNRFYSDMSNSYYSGDIKGTNNVGGIIGYGDMIGIGTSYASGSINANQYVGGVAGRLLSSASGNTSYSNITSCVSANEIIVGIGGNTGRIYGSIGDNVTIGQTGTTSANKGLATAKVTSAGATVDLSDSPQQGTNVGASTLRLKSNYVGMGWDFDNYWKIQETECYPYKAAQCAPPKITSQLIAGATSVSGQSIDGGTVVLLIGDNTYTGAVSSNQWTINVPEGLQSGATIKACATKSGLMQSYYTTGVVSFVGSGTEDDPYLIYTASDLANINSYSYYKIMNDIDVSGWITANSPTTGWIPVGMNSGVSMKQLDGNGKTISGYWTNTTTNYYGLISTANDAVINNLTINLSKNSKVGANSAILVGKSTNTTFENININGNLSGGTCLGAITGLGISNTFNNCEVTSNVTSSGVAAGGICGNSTTSTFNNCSVTGQIKGTNYTGGIAGGEAGSNTFTLCFVEGTITGSNYTGGIAPYCTQSVTKCKSNSTITGSSYVGGLIGKNNATVSECFSDGSVKATATSDCYAGGLFGTNNGNVTNCYSNSTVTSGEYAAGIAGINYGSIDKCYASGNITTEKWGAGIVGYNDGNGASVNNCFAANNKIQVSEAGGIGMRMIGGFRNGASEPNNTNYALNSMVVSVNNVTKIIYDDPLEGISVTQAQLYAQSTYVNNGWNFTDIWGIDEGNGYPFLLVLAEPEFTPGDVNDDGTIDVADYVDVASYILEQDPQPFNFAAADLDEDNAIDVGDLVGVAYLALNYEGAPMLASAINTPESASIAMDATVSSTASGQYEVAINLNNNIALSAMQMDINLPQGMTLVDASLSDRASASHKLAFNQLANGDYRLLTASSTLKSFKSNDGVVLTFTLAGTPSGDGRLSGIKLATPAATRYSIDDIELNFAPTGIENLTTAARIYSEGNNIVIVSPSDGMAQIVLPNGMNKTVKVATGRNVVETPAKGLVIVKMGNEAKKLRF